MIGLKEAWFIGSSFAPGCRFVCSGGLDNTISIFDLQKVSGPEAPCCELNGHAGYISACRFHSDEFCTSTSGDESCAFWNIEKSKLLTTFTGHGNDVTYLDLNRKDPNLFETASADITCRLWDVRIPSWYIQVFEGHEQDVDGNASVPEGSYGFVSASDDKNCRLRDIRSNHQGFPLGLPTSGLRELPLKLYLKLYAKTLPQRATLP